MLPPDRRERLSRYLALILRHQGPQTGLGFDPRGSTALAPLVEYFGRNPLYRWVQAEDIEDVVQNDPKGRYEIGDGRVRAKYGHTFVVQEPSNPAVPPERLFCAVAPHRVAPILRGGLRPLDRALLHLSIDEADAIHVASRHDRYPALLEIAAGQAHATGVKFYQATERIYLAAAIPGEFIRQRG